MGPGRTYTAVVVGSGPNGLAAAVRLARSGLDVTIFEAAETIGGGTRTSEMIIPGLVHDHCSAVHPIAAASPFLGGLDLGARGVRWLQPEVDCAHPLDDGSAGVMYRSLERTVEALGGDGARWRRVFGASVEHFEDLIEDTTKPLLGIPSHPVSLARFGVTAATAATTLVRLWSNEQTRALWGGIAAHTFHRLDRPLTSAVGAMLIVAGHAKGWVVAEGGTGALTQALARDLIDHGGQIVTGHCVESAADLPPCDVLMLDVSPSAAVSIMGDRLPARVAKAYRKFEHGPGAFKVDFAVEGGVPWVAHHARRAGTVHVGGAFEEVAANELAIHRGEMPDRPFVLVGQQYLADPGRSVGDVHPVWSYAHVPRGYGGDATQAIVAQIERFAPGFRERVVGTAVRSTTEMSVSNANYVGGDIIGGASSPQQLLFRPRVGLDPYSTGIEGVWLCSASTPPGAGAHGMCGANAAERALRQLGDGQHKARLGLEPA